MKEVKDNKTRALVAIVRDLIDCISPSILVVGCGDGREAGVLARSLNASTIGIDIGEQFQFDRDGSAPAELKIMDAQQLDFPDASFDFVYSFHALEHIPDHKAALSEMARVLKPNGSYLIGTPNKSRVVGYLNSPTSLNNKIKWNLADYRMRATGRWSNEAGAHAGFTERDLLSLCHTAFGDSSAVTKRYYKALYARKANLVEVLGQSGAGGLLFPAVYVAGHKV
uniref:Class I SAM-dependent methyltransferase n=1 Tax=Bradyrhizobium amphicarpaeae TaxID=1404768 RepID=A0A2U8Q307_9BRAD|nr:class I SAM-dependent methyltransferase [Bradyrhizobium amphicarpaeae]